MNRKHKELIRELEKEIKDLQWHVRHLMGALAYMCASLGTHIDRPEVVIAAKTEAAGNVTLAELAQFVIDKKPIMRDVLTEVVKPSQEGSGNNGLEN